MKKLLSVKESMKYLGISEVSVRRMISEHKVKTIKIGNKFFISKTSLDELYDPRPFNPQYITMSIHDVEVQVIVNTGWVPFDDYLHMHDVIFCNEKCERVYDEQILESVINELKIIFHEYNGIYIKRWRYSTNEDFYFKNGFSYSGVEDLYICNWE